MSEQEKSKELARTSDVFLYNPSILTYNWFAKNIDNIYPSNKTLLLKGGQAYVVSKFIEEGGELHRAYSGFLSGKADIEAIRIELADITSWVISCWDIRRQGRDLDKELLSYYYHGCPACKNVPCQCPSYSISTGVEEAVRDLANYFRSLKQNVYDSPPEIDEALRIADEINANRKFGDSKKLVQKAEVAVNVVERMEKFSDAGKKLVVNIRTIISNLSDIMN